MRREETGAGERWRLRAARARVACKKLALGPINEAYCRDIDSWFPDVQFRQMPPPTPSAAASAPSASTTSSCRRYICSHCKMRAASRKVSAQATLAAAQAVAMAFGLRPEEEVRRRRHKMPRLEEKCRSSTGGDDKEVEGSKLYGRSLPLLPASAPPFRNTSRTVVASTMR
ncbi:hypothetical protein T492DRAFT_1140666 [Pavlovales sp. CCMP2436]|nr:hypothetical protein T492DRAFT_1140666 [Pavlovales sp. CCMP2436]